MIEIIRSIVELRERLSRADQGKQLYGVGLIPTMGSLHEGHLALMRRARGECGTVVMSLFVNPSQFNDPADLAAYPRDEARDAELAESVGADVLFAPSPIEMYPTGFATTVSVSGLTERLEGASRGASHFHGVTTVVAKLLNIVQPDVAYFGQKDAQQALIVTRMVRDLDIPVRIEVCPTVRESDGLALSSRNVRLGGDDRQRALSLSRGLEAARLAMLGGERSARMVEQAGRQAMAAFHVEPEYFSVVDPDTLESLNDLRIGQHALVVVAARVGPVRLIDNVPVVVA